MTDKAAEQRGYSKGYAAGVRRAAREGRADMSRAMREDFVQRMMIAIAPQLIAQPWGRKVNGEHKSFTGAKDISENIRHVADACAKHCSFDPIIAEPSSGPSK